MLREIAFACKKCKINTLLLDIKETMVTFELNI